MNKKYKFTNEVFEKLVQGLLYVEEEKDNLVDCYFPEPSRQRDEFKHLINEYIKQVDNLVKNVEVSADADNVIPFVTIGSEVCLQDLENNELTKLRLVLPFQNTGNNDASFVSPFGRALLLRRVNEKVDIETPSGFFQYKVNSISMPFP